MTTTDTGQLAQLAAAIVDTLAAIEIGGVAVFKTAALWKHQITLKGAGPADFGRYAPFAFVGYLSAVGSREGGFDLRQTFRLVVMIGAKSKEPGVCCWGDATHPGTSRLRELVIEALDQKHPGAGFESDEAVYTSEVEWIDNETEHGIQLYFDVPSMAVIHPQE
jgi:hypothetical protein